MTQSPEDAVNKYIELYQTKAEVSQELKDINKELRDLKPVVSEYLEQQGKTQLNVNGVELLVQSNPRKLRKSKKLYEEELKQYLQGLGVSNVDTHVEELQKLKSGEATVVSDIKVVS